MYKNSSKILFFIMIISSTFLILSSNSWLSIWLGLEINLISFISFILINKKSNMIESSIIYFILQSLASIIFLLTIMMSLFTLKNFMYENSMFKLMIISLMMKMGAAPMHFWLPLVMEGMNWMNNYMLMTWQKLGPIILISYNINYSMFFFMILSSITGAIGGLNQSSIKKLMAFSSINQISWFLLALLNKKFLWFTYFIFYFFIMINVILMFNKFNLNFINQIYMIKFNKMVMMFLFFNILSMGGLPPFLGFFPKMLIIMSLKNYLLIFLMIMCTLITLYFYLRLMYSLLLMNFKSINYLNKKIKLNLLIKLSFISNFMLMFMFFF